MKKVLLSVAAICAFGIASAQDAKSGGGKGFSNGDIFMSGAVGFSTTKQGDNKTDNFTVAPSVGMFVSDNIAVGITAGVSTSKTENPPAEDIKTTNFAVGAFGRWYATPKNDFSFFAELGAFYGSQKTEQGPAESKNAIFGAQLSPNISYFVSEHFALEAGFGALSYTNSNPDADGIDSSNSFALGLDLTNITFGLTYKF